MLPESRTVVFGAFDRHNLGDLLFADVAAALLPGRDPVFAGKPCKQDAYVAAWEMVEQPGVVPLDDLAAGLAQALRADPLQLAAHSVRLAGLCREGCAQWIEWLG